MLLLYIYICCDYILLKYMLLLVTIYMLLLYMLLLYVLLHINVVTPHAQHERGKVIGLGVLVYIYICLWSKKFESYFSGRLTFSNSR